MMQQVKYALFFILGIIYASAWWLLAVQGFRGLGSVFPFLVVATSTIGLIIVIGIFFIDHWKDR